jgi:hypothetical protein
MTEPNIYQLTSDGVVIDCGRSENHIGQWYADWEGRHHYFFAYPVLTPLDPTPPKIYAYYWRQDKVYEFPNSEMIAALAAQSRADLGVIYFFADPDDVTTSVI